MTSQGERDNQARDSQARDNHEGGPNGSRTAPGAGPNRAEALGAYFLGAMFLCWIAAIVYYVIWERADQGRLLLLSDLVERRRERFEVVFSTVSKTVFLTVPAVAFALTLRGTRNQRMSRGLSILALTLPFWFLLLDRSLYQSVGRHLKHLLPYLLEPQGNIGAGNATLWVGPALVGMVIAVVTATIVHIGASWMAERWLAPLAHRAAPQAGRPPRLLGSVPPWGAALSMFALGVVLGGLSGLPLVSRLFLESSVEERLYGSFPWDMRIASELGGRSDPHGRLQQRLNEIYRSRYADLQRPFVPPAPEFSEGPRPHIVFIVAESLRKDALDEQHMPRLSAWANRSAHVFSSHQAGTYSSEAGMFALLYGRSNVAFHQTLNAQVPPLLFSWLRTMGYEIHYMTGHPIVWLRREEFLSKQSVDVLHHDSRGDWPDWDRRALRAVRDTISNAKRPTFSVVFLMSSHFEYRYPKDYQRHLPVAQSKFNVTEVTALGEEDRTPHFNRYKNTLGFFDDLVTDTIESLPDETLIVVTGDHGEAFYEGGLYGHGFSFTEPVLTVPMIVRFPSDPRPEYRTPQVIGERLTLHRDVPGWIARYLSPRTAHLPGYQGRADFTADERRSSIFSSYADPAGRLVYGMLHLETPSGPVRARITLRNHEPRLKLLGFQERFGRPMKSPLHRPENSELIAREFEAQLDALLP